jgi:hypothetical protein
VTLLLGTMGLPAASRGSAIKSGRSVSETGGLPEVAAFRMLRGDSAYLTVRHIHGHRWFANASCDMTHLSGTPVPNDALWGAGA